MVIQNNKVDDAANIVDIAVKMTGHNVKQHKRQGQTDIYWFDHQCKRREKIISGLSEKE
jgi:hypothetical protein